MRSGEIGTLFRSGGGGGGGGREPGEWVARPGERYPTRSAAAERERPEPQEQRAGIDLRGVARDLFGALRERDVDIDFRDDGGERAVEPGDYAVILRVGSTELRRTVTVLRAAGYEPPPAPDRRELSTEEQREGPGR